MGKTLLEGRHTGQFIVSEPDRLLSRSVQTLAQNAAATAFQAGTVLGKITASGKFAPFDEDGADGTENAAGICLTNYDAVDGDVEGVVITGQCVVNDKELIWPDTADAGEIAAATAQLEALGIKVLTGTEKPVSA